MKPSDETIKHIWTGRVDDAEGISGRRWHQIVTPSAQSGTGDIVLVGFQCDEGVRRNGGRTGSAEGPAAIRAALANLPVWPQLSLKDFGDIACQGEALEQAQENYATAVSGILKSGAFPIALGGGHEIAFASFSALAKYLDEDTSAPAKIGIINLDAHLDIRADARPSSGTPFLQMKQHCDKKGWNFNYMCLGASLFANTASLFERASEIGATIVYDDEMATENSPFFLQKLQDFAAQVDHLYLTIDMDGLPAAVAPGVSAPAAFGIQPAVIEMVIKALAKTGKLRLADIAELNPKYDIDSRTARTAARFIARIAREISQATAQAQ